MTVNLLGLTFNTFISIRIKEQKFKTFIKPFETPQENVKVNIFVNFYLNTTGGFSDVFRKCESKTLAYNGLIQPKLLWV